MKINLILILILSVMICNSKSEEFETMDIEWKKLELSVLENNTHRALVTYKDDIIFEPQLQISKDKGKTTRKFSYLPEPETMPDYFVEFSVNNILGYAYDSQNGIYLIDYINKTSSDPTQGKIYYIPADKDTVFNLISFDIPDVPEQTNYIYSTFMYIDNSIIISNRRQIWIYDISQKKINTVKFVDSLNNELNNQVISEFSIQFCYYKKEQSRLDIVYTVNNYLKYKYSDDGGKTFVDGVYNANCFNRGSLNNSMYLWNGNDSWYGNGTSNEGTYYNLIRMDNYCVKEIIPLDTIYRQAIVSGHNFLSANASNFIYFYPENDTNLNKIYYSSNKGEKVYIIKNFPLPFVEVNFLPAMVFADGTILLNLQKQFGKKEFYLGTPKPTSVHNLNKIEEIKVYPNPTSDFITIQTLEVYKVQIFNMLGVEVISTPSAAADTPQEGNFRIDVSDLQPGVYFVKIGDRVEKFVKM